MRRARQRARAHRGGGSVAATEVPAGSSPGRRSRAAGSRGGTRVVAIVPAGGVGARMGRARPKQFLVMGGMPILALTLRALGQSRLIDGLVIAAPEAWIAETWRLVRRHRIPRVLEVVAGGQERQESVWLALQAVPAGARWVLVHDGVRPFIDGRLIETVLVATRRVGAAICALETRETVKRVRRGLVQTTLDRRGLWLVQTPQGFRRDLLWEAHDTARRDGFAGTDDAALVERLGAPVGVVPGLPRNVKITTPGDLALAGRWLRSRGAAGA